MKTKLMCFAVAVSTVVILAIVSPGNCDTLCMGKMEGQYSDGFGNNNPLTLQMRANLKETREDPTGGNGTLSIETDWLNVKPNGHTSFRGTGNFREFSNYAIIRGLRKLVAQTFEISFKIANPKDPKYVFDGSMEMKINYMYDSTGRQISTQTNALMQLKGIDGSSANLQGTPIVRGERPRHEPMPTSRELR